jgi:hypothetical protein
MLLPLNPIPKISIKSSSTACSDGWIPTHRGQGEKYQRVHTRLIKIFICRGSHIAQDLADKTINRVARKLAEIQATYVGDPAYYFAGVANFIYKESLRAEIPPAVGLPKATPPDADEERDYSCLEECLRKLKPERPHSGGRLLPGGKASQDRPSKEVS